MRSPTSRVARLGILSAISSFHRVGRCVAACIAGRIRAGVPGLSENIRVRSIIGRFLEHSRVVYFDNDGDPEVFIGSADIMKRNLDERTEVLTPIKHAPLRSRIKRTMDLFLQDRRQSWILHDTAWTRDQTIEDMGIHAQLLALAPFS